jgi:predicted nucleic-acid-binding protein
VISVDTNILARFYVDDPDDAESVRQSPLVRRMMLESQAVFVPLTVVRELKWVIRGLYEPFVIRCHTCPECRTSQ